MRPIAGVNPPAPGRASQHLLSLASLVVVVAGLKLGAPILVPFAAAFFLALRSLPLLMARGARVPPGSPSAWRCSPTSPC